MLALNSFVLGLLIIPDEHLTGPPVLTVVEHVRVPLRLTTGKAITYMSYGPS